MIGIEQIGTYIPSARISNYARREEFGLTDDFIDEKLGVRSVARKDANESMLDLCVKAYADLEQKDDIDRAQIDLVVVVTQNPGRNIPHASAELHGRLGLSENCACFDISLGCSGYVYALSIATSFMAQNGLHKALLFTADPYSDIVDPTDKNTTLLFGDAATVTLLGDAPVYTPGCFTFGTMGSEADQLACNDGQLYMNGRAVFNFAARYVPTDLKRVLELNQVSLDEIDEYIFHQGSKFIVDTIRQRTGIPDDKARFCAGEYGNTVSSSIPLLLSDTLNRADMRRVLISGFGLGFSWASTVLFRQAGAT